MAEINSIDDNQSVPFWSQNIQTTLPPQKKNIVCIPSPRETIQKISVQDLIECDIDSTSGGYM